MKTGLFKVENVVDGNTIIVSPRWQWHNETGNNVIINNFSKITDNFLLARLRSLLGNREVELKNPIKVEGGAVYCYIFLDGVNIKNYFPELQPH
jgi:hypothetical protein